MKLKQSVCIKATKFEAECPYCGKWDDWGSYDPSGLQGECQHCGKEYEVSPHADIESYQ